MKNKLSDLNNHLFAEMERLGDEDLQGEELQKEIERAKAITGVSSQIISNAALVVKAMEIKANAIDPDIKMPKMLVDGDVNE